jgi:hypothetical protein
MAPAADEGGKANAGLPPSKASQKQICVLPNVGVHQQPVPPDHGSGIGHDVRGSQCGRQAGCAISCPDLADEQQAKAMP